MAEETQRFERNLQEVMEWQFSPETGSQFWLDRLPRLDFDPLHDIKTAADLALFPDFSSELRDVPAEHLVPRPLAGKHFRVYDSGGTSGAPKHVIDREYRRELQEWGRRILISHGAPESGNWLHVGPTGPHVVGFQNFGYAELGGGFCYTIDMDPRWVKRLLAAGQTDVVSEYLEHLLDQAHNILSTQDIAMLWITPPLLERLCARTELYELVRAKVRGIVWGGTAFSAESLHELETHFFPDTPIIGGYGNTLMGVAPQRPRQDGDPYPCVFEPYEPTTRIDPVDDEGDVVGYGERGRVRFHLVTKEMLLPSVLERDTAVRVPPRHDSAPDGVADLGTFTEEGSSEIFEGVY